MHRHTPIIQTLPVIIIILRLKFKFIPQSIVVVCDGLSPPVNGTLLLSSVVFNSQATYGCNSGFMINGPTVRICQQTGSWSGNVSTCEGEYSNY